MKACLFCNSQENITITMSMALESGKPPIEIHLCEKHQNNTKVSSLQKAYEKKKAAIQKLLEQAKMFGLTIGDSPKAAPAPAPASVPADAPAEKTPEQKTLDGGQTASVVPSDNAFAPKMQGHKIDQTKAPKVTSVEEQVIERSDGLPLRVPSKIRGEAGTTSIVVRPSQSDKELQTRHKEHAKATMDENPGRKVHNFNKDGYGVKDCTLCEGTGFTKANNQVCGRCKGSGMSPKL
jgi:hypothetical protein